MTFRSILSAALFFVSAGVYTASATPIASFNNQVITNLSRTELGRPFRNGVPQSWTTQEAYPGVNSATVNTMYYYNTYTLNYANFVPNNFVEISFTDTNDNGLLFISAYANSYNPANRAQNWLGDLGYQSNAYGGDSLTFQVGLSYQNSLVLVVTTTGGGTGTNSGLNNPFDIYISAYTDSGYDDADVTGHVTPEPSTFIELGTGLLAIAGVARRRLFAA